MSKNAARTLKTVARQAKQRIKENFWEGYRIERAARIEIAKQNGVNEQEAERFLSQEIERKIRGEQQTDDHRFQSERGRIENTVNKIHWVLLSGT